MSWRTTSAAAVCAAMISVTGVGRAGPDQAGLESLTTEVWIEPDPPLELHWQLLSLPEHVVELMLAPLALGISWSERTRLHLRLWDLLRSEDGRVYAVPQLKLALGDGLGAGAKLNVTELSRGRARLSFGGLRRINGDYEVGVRYRTTVAAAEGRQLDVRVDYELDQNQPYFGLGGGTRPEDERALGARYAEATAAFDVASHGSQSWSGAVLLGVRAESLATGHDVTAPGLGAEPDDPVARPPGFDATAVYPQARVSLTYDSRDSIGRPTTGFVGVSELSYLKDASGTDLSGVTVQTHVTWHVPLLPLERVLSVSAGAGAAFPGWPGDEIPLSAQMTLGRKEHLRGYSRSRFVASYAWWAGTEYRFRVWDYTRHAVVLAPSLFLEVGQALAGPASVVELPLRYSGGISVRAAHDRLSLFQINVGLSPEGPQLDFSLGAEL